MCEEQTRDNRGSEAGFLLREELLQGQCGEKDPDTFQESTRKCRKQRSLLVAHELGKVGMGSFGWSIMDHAKGILLSPEHCCEATQGLRAGRL